MKLRIHELKLGFKPRIYSMQYTH